MWDFPKIMGESVRMYLPRIPPAHNYKPASQLEKVHQSAWSGDACAPLNDERRPSRSTNLHVAEPGVSVQKQMPAACTLKTPQRGWCTSRWVMTIAGC
jgi:hypothetical protein